VKVKRGSLKLTSRSEQEPAQNHGLGTPAGREQVLSATY